MGKEGDWLVMTSGNPLYLSIFIITDPCSITTLTTLCPFYDLQS